MISPFSPRAYVLMVFIVGAAVLLGAVPSANAVDGPYPPPPCTDPLAGLTSSSITATSLYVTCGTTVYFKAAPLGEQWHDFDTVGGTTVDQGNQTLQMQWDFDWASGSFDNQKQCWPPAYTTYTFNTSGKYTVKNRCDDVGTAYNDTPTLATGAVTIYADIWTLSLSSPTTLPQDGVTTITCTAHLGSEVAANRTGCNITFNSVNQRVKFMSGSTPVDSITVPTNANGDACQCRFENVSDLPV